MAQQQLHQLQLADQGGIVQRRDVLVALGVHIAARFDQDAGHVKVAVIAGLVEGSPA